MPSIFRRLRLQPVGLQPLGTAGRLDDPGIDDSRPEVNRDPRRARSGRKVVLALGLIGLLLLLGASAKALWPEKGVDVREGTTLVTAKGMAARYGIDVTLIGVTAAGGLVDFRYQVVDPDKADPIIHDLDLFPKLIEERTGAMLAMRSLPAQPQEGAGVRGHVLLPAPQCPQRAASGLARHARDRRRSARAHRRQGMIWSLSSMRCRVIAVLGLAVLSLLGAASASAHTSLTRSEPPNGGKVSVGRSSFTLWFSEPVSVAASTFHLRTLAGTRVPVTVSGAASPGRRVVEIRTKPLRKETYLLTWSALSLDDGHPSSGSTVFGVGIRPAAVQAAEDGLPGAPGLVLRWLDLAAIMLAIGALAVSGRVLRSLGAAGAVPLQRARTIGAAAAGVAVISGAISPFLRVPRAGASLGGWADNIWVTLTATPWGNLWLARELVLVVVAVALWSWATGRDESGRGMHFAVLSLAAVVVLEGLAGHAADLPRQSGVAAVSSAVHLAAAGVWAGGLAVLALCVIPVMRREPESRTRILASVWRTFSPIAAIATVVLVATGLYESGRYLPGPGSVGSTVYGGAVAGKAVLLAVALIPAGVNTLLVNPRLAASVGRLLGRPPGWTPVAPRHFVRLLVAEACLIVVAVAAAALVTTVPTAREVGAGKVASTSSAANVGGLFVTFEEVSAGTDRTRLIVRARSTIKPEPAPIAGVDVRLTGPTGTAIGALVQGRRARPLRSRDSPAWASARGTPRSPCAVTACPMPSPGSAGPLLRPRRRSGRSRR